MLWALAIIFALLWALGLATSYTLGGFIHVFIGVTIALLVIRIVKGSGHRKASAH